MQTFASGMTIACLCGLLMVQACRGADPLDPADKKMLEDLIGHPLPDPAGAQRVRVKVSVRTVWAGSEDIPRECWLKAGENGRPPRIYFAGGNSIPAPADKDIAKVDFFADCQIRFGAAPRDQDQQEEGPSKEVFEQMHRTAVGDPGTDDSALALAAWLHRLGKDDLAANALKTARAGLKGGAKDPLAALQEDLAWEAFSGMVHAYMVRADEDAIAYAKQFTALKIQDKEYAQAPQIIEELQRRQKKGTFGKEPTTQPAPDYERLPVDRKVAFWIEALDEVDARQMGQPGGIDLSSDLRVASLISLGEPAVSALIDTVEKDERLTRSVHFWRDFSHDRTVISVREAALTAVVSILRVHVFEPDSTGDTFTSRGSEGTNETVATLRAYWEKYGKVPFDQRMMMILTDHAASPDATREAADNLANLQVDRTLGTTVWSGHQVLAPAKGPNPAIAKFQNPTAAEAILAAMDRNLAYHDATDKDKQLFEYERHLIEDAYFASLVQLGDRRIAPELTRRSQSAANATMRRKFAFTSQALGDPNPFNAYADDFAAGRIKIDAAPRPDTNPADQPSAVELKGIVSMLSAARTDHANAALFALADPKHPHHDLVLENLQRASPGWPDDAEWFRHPYWILLFRPLLDDTHATGGHYSIEKSTFRFEKDNGSSTRDLPDFLSDPAKRVESADERECDMAAQKYAEMVLGLPTCHPLLKDNPERLARLREILDRFQRNFRLPTPKEAEALKLSPWDVLLLPNIPPLGRPATDQDVKAGRALFSLPAGAKLAGLKLPAIAYRQNNPSKQGRPEIIVQAEIGSDGRTLYGVIGNSQLGPLPATEFAPPVPIDDLPDPATQ